MVHKTSSPHLAPSEPESPTLTEDLVRQRAYELLRGTRLRKDGHELDDWFKAEGEILGEETQRSSDRAERRRRRARLQGRYRTAAHRLLGRRFTTHPRRAQAVATGAAPLPRLIFRLTGASRPRLTSSGCYGYCCAAFVLLENCSCGCDTVSSSLIPHRLSRFGMTRIKGLATA